MPEYDFRAPDGSIRTAVFAMKDAPSIGSTVEIDGVPCVRLPSDSQLNTNPLSKRYPVESRVLPRNIPGCKKSPRGLPIIQNREHERRIAGTYGFIRED